MERPHVRGTRLAHPQGDMSFIRIAESWGEALLRIGIGVGLAWIGIVEGAGYGLFLDTVGSIFIAAGIGEIWSIRRAG